ncbi:MAG: ribonuclease E/G, partial [Rhodospirillales bacterium]
DEALSPVVALPGGGSLIVSQTPALTAIDVNSGGADAGSREQTALEVDLEAAAEAARQVRLRNISGLIVIDFVPVRDAGHKRQVLDALRDAATGDPAGPHVVGHTRMGLVEMTRRRHGPSLLEIMGEPWPAGAEPAPAKSSLTLALDALRGTLREARGKGAPRLVLRVPPAVAEAIQGPARTALEEAEGLLGVAIEPAPDQTLAPGAWDVGAWEGE